MSYTNDVRLNEILLRYRMDVSVWDELIDYERALVALYMHRSMASYLSTTLLVRFCS